MSNRTGYITLGEAAKRLGVQRATLYYYIKTFELEKPKKFDLDKNKYLKITDVERIEKLRSEAGTAADKEVA